jgi:hypothetical protein
MAAEEVTAVATLCEAAATVAGMAAVTPFAVEAPVGTAVAQPFTEAVGILAADMPCGALVTAAVT